jgi:hypothetical protein
VLLDPATSRNGVLNLSTIARKIDAHERGERDYSVQIFNWLALELWCRRFLSGRYVPRAAPIRRREPVPVQ